MKNETQARVDHYLRLLDGIKQKVNDEMTAVRILGEVAKDMRMAAIRDEKGKSYDSDKGDTVMTEKQKKFMSKLGIKIPKGMNPSKKEASLMIDEHLANSNGASEEENYSSSSSRGEGHGAFTYMQTVPIERVADIRQEVGEMPGY